MCCIHVMYTYVYTHTCVCIHMCLFLKVLYGRPEKVNGMEAEGVCVVFGSWS